MSTVGTTHFLEDGDRNYITLNPPCEQYIRRMVYRSTWKTAYIGILCSIQSTSNINGGLWFGLGSSTYGNVGMKNGVAAIPRMIGTGTGKWMTTMGYGAGWETMTYSNADISGSSFTCLGNVCAAISGGSIQSTTGDGTVIITPTAEIPYRKGISTILKLAKSGLTITAQRWALTSGIYTGSNGTNHNFTDNTLFSAMGGDIPFLDGNQMNFGSTCNLTSGATDDASYPLDTINVCWTGSAPLRIYQIAMQIVRAF